MGITSHRVLQHAASKTGFGHTSLYNRNVQAQLLILIVCANVTLNKASYVIVREKRARKVHDTTEPYENFRALSL